ncbi:MAG: hypothetical protein GYB49_09005 [Alphaproteobacteria bacterium]|nr:hypothetical protein [Hyphomonas sp.]MBR9807346.1 hypothetical protein [Alphaproteobacteria bacterium]|tara:strand:+ start:387 stop:710 length:324 start_codon:yes stop_codon:yes gene_type:complete
MRVLILTFAAMAALTACNQKSDREILTETCVADGETPATCQCITAAMEENLSPDLFRRTAAAIGREKRDVSKFVSSLKLEEQLEFASVLTEMVSCELSQPDEASVAD